MIEAIEGDVFLIAQEVVMPGRITAKQGDVFLIGASELLLAPKGDKRCFIRPQAQGCVDASGVIEAIQAEIHAAGGSAYALAINHTGIVEVGSLAILEARQGCLQSEGTVLAKGGEVSILADEVHLYKEACIDVSGEFGGGSVSIKASQLFYGGEGVKIQANATGWGDGGQVVAIGESALFAGTIEARGGDRGGNGGFVEVSGIRGFDYRGKTDTRAPMGRTGTLLLDPSDITISTSASSPAFPTSPGTYDPPGPTATLNNTNLQTGLGSSNILVTTSGGAGGTGTITWSAGADITWSAATKLTLNADKSMTLNANVTNTGTGSFTAMDFIANSGGTAGTFTGITLAGNLSSAEGAIQLTGRGGDSGSNNMGIFIGSGASIQSTGSGASAASITLNGHGGGDGGATGGSNNFGVEVTGAGTLVTSADGAISITGQSFTIRTGAGQNNNHGISLSSGGGVSSTGTATIDLNGTGAPANATNTGLTIDGTNTKVTSVSGAISITGQGGAATGGNNSGIVVSSSGLVSSTGTGGSAATITINGTGGAGTTNNNGVYVLNAGSAITSVDGAINITGQGEGTTTNSVGVQVQGGGTISSTGTASMTIMGTGTNGTNGNVGIEVTGAGAAITSTDGSMTLTGIGQGTGTTDRGILLTGNATTLISYGGSSAGSIILTGTGSGTSGDGVQINGTGGLVASSASPKSVSITGIGSGAGGTGILIGDPVGGANASGDFTFETDTITTSGATIQTSGTMLFEQLTPSTSIGLGGGAGTFNMNSTQLAAIQSGAASVTFGRANGSSTMTVNNNSFNNPVILRDSDFVTGGTGTITTNTNDNLTIIADTVAINTAVNVTGTGVLTIKPLSPATTIGLGTGATGTLNLDSTELGYLGSATTVNFGDSLQTGAVDLQANTYAYSPVVYGDSITVDGTVDAGANNITFNLGSAGAGTLTLNADVTTTGTFQVNGGANNDAFNVLFQPTAATATMDGGGGTNTLTGPNMANAWAITSSDGGTLNTNLAFSNMQDLVGGTGNDAFTFHDGGSISGTINGTGSSGNSFNYTPYTSNVSINLQTSSATATGGFSNIQSFTGGAATNTLIGTNTANTWDITSSNTGTFNTTTSFSGFQNLTGGTSTDDFVFSDGAAVTGTINGTSSSGNQLDFTAYTTAVSVNLQTGASTGGNFANIQSFIGGSGSNTLTGTNTANTWDITSSDAGTFNTTISFSKFGNLTGGTSTDDFVFSDGISVTGTIDGGSSSGNEIDLSAYTTNVSVNFQTGSSTAGNFTNIQSFIGGSGTNNTLTGANAANTWNITSLNSGTYNTTISFSGFQNLTGGTSTDDFVFSDGATISGLIDGTSSSGNQLDFTAYTSAVSVNLQTSASTGGNFANIQSFIGGSGSNTLTGTNTANTWDITGSNAGTFNTTITFSAFQNLTGGTSTDDFVFSNGAAVTGTIDGTSSSGNQFDFSLYTTAVSVNLQTGASTGGNFTNIQSFTGGTGSNTLTGTNTANTWDITSSNTGTFNTTTSFFGFQNLVGGSVGDDFVFSDGALVTGTIFGSSASGNQFDFTAYTSAVSVNLQTGASSGGSFSNIQTFLGGSGSNTITGANTVNTWVTTATNSGTINGSITFSQFATLVGGSLADTFDFTSGFTVASVNGGAGSNTIKGPNTFNVWNITSNNQGTVAGIAFSNIGSLVGGTGLDDFVFADQVGLTGSIDGGGPALGNLLDYRLFTTPAYIQLSTPTSGTASNLGGGFSDIGSIIGNVIYVQPTPPSPPTPIFTTAVIQYYSTIVGTVIDGIYYYSPFYDPQSIRYGLFSALNRVLELPIYPRRIIYWQDSEEASLNRSL